MSLVLFLAGIPSKRMLSLQQKVFHANTSYECDAEFAFVEIECWTK